jgi:hypothetical protein
MTFDEWHAGRVPFIGFTALACRGQGFDDECLCNSESIFPHALGDEPELYGAGTGASFA